MIVLNWSSDPAIVICANQMDFGLSMLDSVND